MKLSCSAYQAGASSYAQKILSGHTHQNYGATSSTANPTGESTHGLKMPSWKVEEIEGKQSPNDASESNEGSSSFGAGTSVGKTGQQDPSSRHTSTSSHSHSEGQPDKSDSTGKTQDLSRSPSESPANRLGLESRSRSKSVGEQQWTNLRAVMAWYARLRRIKRSKSNQRWMKLRTTVQISGSIITNQKKNPLKREDSFLKRFSTRQVPEAQETFEIGDEDGCNGDGTGQGKVRRKKKRSLPRTVINPDGNFYFYWLFLLTVCVLYNLWTLIVRESFPELQSDFSAFWITADIFTDLVILLDLPVQFRTGYLEQGLMVYKTKKLANHYVGTKNFWLDVTALLPTDLLQLYFGTHPMFRVPRFLKIYRMYNYYYMVESRTIYPNVWRVINLIHILLLLAHWFGCFYYLISKAEGFEGPWAYPNTTTLPEFAPLTRKYLGSLYWSTLTLTTIGDLPTPYSNWQYLFTIVSYLIGVFIFATIVGQVGNVITNRNANRLEFERLLDGAKMYMRHHRVPRDMQRRVLRWYDYSWSRGRIQGGGDINTALGLLPDKLKTELALHVNLSVLKKVTIFQECQPEFLHDLVLKMKAYIFTPGDLICRKGEVAREMFIIADGILEVISETGRVLTTMQAGDFFGEIGILNLDGLNKRTADVRSVGYAELFSLSREDVLAAMKDYPEAQEILQTLGRKRLMLARKANATYAKKQEKKSPLHLLGTSLSKGPGEESASDTTGKRIVEKLRSDVKGLRNAIKKSRRSNSSKEDSSEPESSKEKVDNSYASVSRRRESTVSVQQYYGGGGGRSSIVGSMIPASSAGRGVLKRMHNVVLSDEKEKVGIGGDVSLSNLSPTILPKRVQVQFPTQDTKSARSSVTGESEEREVIGAGLPLIQRLRLLKKKEEKERGERADDEKPTLLGKLSKAEKELIQSPPSIHDNTIFQTKVLIEPLPKVDSKLSRGSSDSSATPTSLKSLVASPTKQSVTRLTSESRGTSNESNTSELGPYNANLTSKEMTSSRPEYIPRPGALRFHKRDSKTYGSVDDLSPEFSRLPFIKKLKILNERQKIAELVTNKSSSSALLTRSTSEGSSEIGPNLPPDSMNMYSVTMGRRAQSSSDEYRKAKAELPPFPLPLPSPSSSSSSSPEKTGDLPTKISYSAKTEGDTGLSGKPPASTTKEKEGDRNQGSLDLESPEGNETPERRHLKSILKTLSRSGESTEISPAPDVPEIKKQELNLDDKQLLKAQTHAGYAARHRKFAKNVTFQRQAVTVVSPESPREQALPKVEIPELISSEFKVKKDASLPGNYAEGKIQPGDIDLSVKPTSHLGQPPELLTIEASMLKTPVEIQAELESRTKSKTDLEGTHEQQMDVIFGIQSTLQTKLEAVQNQFQEKFSSLEIEVRRRDEIISILYQRIQELEERGPQKPLSSFVGRKSLQVSGLQQMKSPLRPIGNGKSIVENHKSDGDGYDEDDDSGEDETNRLRMQQSFPDSSYLFSRGDSIDTVIDNTEALDDDDDVFLESMIEQPRTTNSYLQSFPDTGSGWTEAERESIEMTDFRNPENQMWELEFHRDKNTGVTKDQNMDSIAVEIGNTSTEYESTSDDSDTNLRKVTQPEQSILATHPVQEFPFSLDGSSSEDDGEIEIESSDSECPLDNQNWEVQMLAKELNKIEESKKQVESPELNDQVVEEILELDNEIQEMRNVVSSGCLSPTDLDMLETVLETRTQRVKALAKAFSVDEGGEQVTTSANKPMGFRKASLQCQRESMLLGGLNRSAGKPYESLQETSKGTIVEKGPSSVQRQSSLFEIKSLTSPTHSPGLLDRRRESAGSLGLSRKTPSFFSKFNFIRSLSRTLLPQQESHNGQELSSYSTEEHQAEPSFPEPSHCSSPAQILPSCSSDEPTRTSPLPESSAKLTTGPSSPPQNIPRKCSTSGGTLLNTISTTLTSALSTISPSPLPEPGISQIFTIPSVEEGTSKPKESLPESTTSPSSESSPLLKK